MSRFLAAFGLVLAAAAALLFRHTGGERTPLTAGPRSLGSAAPSPAALATLPSGVDAASGSRVASARWLIDVVDASGAAIPDAALRAFLELTPQASAPLLDGRGRAEWADVLPGTYRLEVDAPGHPTVVRAVTLDPGETRRTVVQVGAPCSVRGRVRDTRGRARASHLVVFLQPSQAVPPATDLLALPHATTDASGAFALDVPQGGAWRLAVVYGGAVLYEEARATQLGPDGPRQADVVVEAATRLVLSVEGEPLVGAVEALSLYRLGTPLELARREELRRRMEALAASGSPEPAPDDPEAAEELRRAREGELAADSDPATRALRARQQHWLRVVPEGWVRVQSTVVPERRVLVLEGLPPDTELRVALRRGDEVFRVTPSLLLPPAADQAARLVPPAPVPAEEVPTDSFRAAELLLEAPSAAPALVPGVTWQ